MRQSTERYAGAAGLGGVAGFTLSIIASAEFAFSLAALVCGFAVAAWAGSVLLAESVRRMQDAFDAAEGWTEAGARRAFSLLAVAGAVGMVGASLATL